MQRYAAGDRPKLRNFWFVPVAVAVVLVILYLGGAFGSSSRRLSVRKLRCVVNQQVTPFGDRVLYYDGTTLYCLSSTGSELWKYMVGSGAGFSVSDTLVTVWVGESLHILDRNGRVTYNDRLSDTIQFARPGSQFVAAAVGNMVSPTLLVKDVNGLAVDSDTVAYEDKIILDMGFFENGEYLWTTALDVYGIAPMTLMNIFRVGAMNTGEVELGEEITYAVLYAGDKLNVVNTRQINRYDYRGTIAPNESLLVYGWQLIDHSISGRDALMLFAPVMQTTQEQSITQLRVLWGTRDNRYTLPDNCVGAGLRGNKLFAFSENSLYQADLSAQRFSALRLDDIPGSITGYIGRLSNGVALVSSGMDVYAVTLP